MPDDESDPDGRSRARVLLIGVSGWYLIALCAFGLAPFYPEIARDLEISVSELGALVGLTSVVATLLQLPAGLLADSWSVRALLVTGLASTAVAALLRGLSGGIVLFGLGQVALGLAIPSFQAGSITAVARTARVGRTATSIGLLFSAFNVGAASSVLVAGVVAAGSSWRTASVALAFVPLLVMPFLLKPIVLPRALAVGLPVSTQLRNAMRTIFAPHLIGIVGIAILSSGSATATLFVVPFLMRDSGLGAVDTGFLLAANLIGAIVGAPLLARAGDQFGARVPLLFALTAGSVVALLLATGLPTGVWLAAAMVAMGLCLSGVPAVAQGRVAADAARSAVGPGAALSGLRMAQAIGPATGPAVAGYLAVTVGSFGAALAGVGAALIVAALIALRLPAESPNLPESV